MGNTRNLGQEILSLRRQGLTYNQIKEKLNCAKSTIHYHCAKAGLTDIGFKKAIPSDEIKARIVELSQTHVIREVAAMLDISPSTVKKYK